MAGAKDGTQSILITKGSRVIMHTHAVQRGAIAWSTDADECKPERWLKGDAKTQQLPFSDEGSGHVTTSIPRLTSSEPRLLAPAPMLLDEVVTHPHY